MAKEYTINGMSCQSCVAKVTHALQSVSEIQSVKIQLSYPQATIESVKQLDLSKINSVLKTTGNYTMSELAPNISLPAKTLSTYKPLILIVGFIAGVSVLAQYPFTSFSWMLWMRHFMAGFFIVFAFFKLLNLKGFSQSYSMYDIIAARWNSWGYIYPFIELTLGILYLTNLYPVETNIATAIILIISSIGVIQSNLNKKKIKCACLGDVFNLPMSTVTIIEDLTMVAMALLMLFMY